MARFTTASTTTIQDTLPTLPANPTNVVPGSGRPGAAKRTAPVRRNGYAAKCHKCQAWIEKGEGALTNEGGRWITRHIGDCPEGEVVYEGDAGVVTKPARPAVAAPVDFKVPEGRFTVVWGNEHVTIRVARQDERSDFMPGKITLAYLSGSDNDRDYTKFAHVADDGTVRVWSKHRANTRLTEAVKVLLGDPKAASQAYAIESNKCMRCNRDLTVPASVHAGLGPECTKKVAW